MDTYIRRKKDMLFRSVKSLKPVEEQIKQIDNLLGVPHKRLHYSTRPEILSAIFGVGTGLAITIICLYLSGSVLGFSSAGISSALDAAGALVGGNDTVGIFVIMMPLFVLSWLGFHKANKYRYIRLKESKIYFYKRALAKQAALKNMLFKLSKLEAKYAADLALIEREEAEAKAQAKEEAAAAAKKAEEQTAEQANADSEQDQTQNKTQNAEAIISESSAAATSPDNTPAANQVAEETKDVAANKELASAAQTSNEQLPDEPNELNHQNNAQTEGSNANQAQADANAAMDSQVQTPENAHVSDQSTASETSETPAQEQTQDSASIDAAPEPTLSAEEIAAKENAEAEAKAAVAAKEKTDAKIAKAQAIKEKLQSLNDLYLSLQKAIRDIKHDLGIV